MQQLDLKCLFKECALATSTCLVLGAYSKDGYGQHPTVCFVFPFFMLSAVFLKSERKQHPRHGFVVLVPCSIEGLAVGNHLRRSQDVANFKSWRGHVQLSG